MQKWRESLKEKKIFVKKKKNITRHSRVQISYLFKFSRVSTTHPLLFCYVNLVSQVYSTYFYIFHLFILYLYIYITTLLNYFVFNNWRAILFISVILFALVVSHLPNPSSTQNGRQSESFQPTVRCDDADTINLSALIPQPPFFSTWAPLRAKLSRE